MENKKRFDSYAQDTHEKAQAAIDHATEVRTTAADELRKKHEKAHREAHLIDDGGIMRCSVCKFPFDLGVKPSLTVAFTEHLFKADQTGQRTEDANQAAARIVRETTES